MALIAACSAKRSPGVTVTTLAFTLSWPGRLILAECDPAGGDIAAGYLREVPLGQRGLAPLGASLRRRRLAEDLWTQLVDLNPDNRTALTRLLLPGLTDPAQARTWAEPHDPGQAPGWEQLARLFLGLENTTGYDVIADCGRLSAPHPPTPVLAAADAVLLVLRPDLPSIRAAATALAVLQRIGAGPVGLVLVGDGPYSAKETALELRTPLVVALPDDPGTARVLSTGGEYHRGRLLRAAARAGYAVGQLVAAGRTARATDTARDTPRPEVRSGR